MGKTRDLFKKTRYKGDISCKDGHDKGQKGQDLTEADVNKRWQEYIELLHKKGLNDLDNHNELDT